MTVVVLLVFLFRAAITASTMMSRTTAAPAQIQIGSVYQTVLLPEVVIPTFTGSWSVNMDSLSMYGAEAWMHICPECEGYGAERPTSVAQTA